jgi:transcriptional regulator with XRE-family HTH domain
MMMDVRRARKEAKMSQFELANAAGISRMRISHAENGYLALNSDEIQAIKAAIRASAQRLAKNLNQLSV